MNLKSFKCPNCGAELNVREGAKRVKCEYCLSVISLEKNSEDPSARKESQSSYDHNIHIEEPSRNYSRPLRSVSSSSFRDTTDFNQTSRLVAKIILIVVQIIASVWGVMFLAVGIMFVIERSAAGAVIAFIIGAALILGPIKLRKTIMRKI